MYFVQFVFISCLQTIRSGQKLLKKKSTEAEKKSGGWFSGFWGKRESRVKEDEESVVPESKCRL